jgi:protocatechuate 3,4-dioxygenase beta subunit
MLVARRDLVVGAAAAAGMSAAPVRTLIPTSSQDLGPFYPILHPADSDADLTRVRGRQGKAMGQPISVMGRIVDLHGNPVRGARIDLWQANAVGRYDHPGDRANPAALDPHFQGFARLVADRHGEFRFRSIKPAAYNTPIGMRTPHIHFSIDGRGERLVTQMYFPGEALNDRDALLKTAARRDSVIAQAVGRSAGDPQALAYRWTVVLANG